MWSKEDEDGDSECHSSTSSEFSDVSCLLM